MIFLPTRLGKLFDYYQYRVIGETNYFKGISWPVKVASVISLLLFIAFSSNKQGVIDYYSLSFFRENDVATIFGSEISIWFLHVITVSYLVLFGLILIESVRMHKYFAPVRVIMLVLFSVIMSLLTVLSISVLIITSVIYLILRIIRFIFFNKSRKDKTESQSDKKGFEIIGFQDYLYKRASFDPETTDNWQEFHTETKTKKITKTKEDKTDYGTRTSREIDFDDDIRKIYPD